MDFQKASEMRFLNMRITYIVIFVFITLFITDEVSGEDNISERIKKIEKAPK